LESRHSERAAQQTLAAATSQAPEGGAASAGCSWARRCSRRSGGGRAPSGLRTPWRRRRRRARCRTRRHAGCRRCRCARCRSPPPARCRRGPGCRRGRARRRRRGRPGAARTRAARCRSRSPSWTPRWRPRRAHPRPRLRARPAPASCAAAAWQGASQHCQTAPRWQQRWHAGGGGAAPPEVLRLEPRRTISGVWRVPRKAAGRCVAGRLTLPDVCLLQLLAAPHAQLRGAA